MNYVLLEEIIMKSILFERSTARQNLAFKDDSDAEMA
jgi:hypothetical protein